MGIPGFSGFAAEIIILIGTWKAFPAAVWITGFGMILVAAFTLRALKKSFFAEPSRELPLPTNEPVTETAITGAEKLGASVLIFATVAVGLYPKMLLDRIVPAVEAMRFFKP
jgi:NADH-quinone oxidoreductase subunit M